MNFVPVGIFLRACTLSREGFFGLVHTEFNHLQSVASTQTPCHMSIFGIQKASYS